MPKVDLENEDCSAPSAGRKISKTIPSAQAMACPNPHATIAVQIANLDSANRIILNIRVDAVGSKISALYVRILYTPRKIEAI